MKNNWSGSCWHCGHSLGEADYARESRCPGCGRASHSCRNCRFHAPGRSNDCLEPVADHVGDKERANFCDYFEPAKPGTGKQAASADDLRRAADDLFDL